MKYKPELRTISYSDIKEIYVHPKGSVWKGIGIGAASGALIGAIVGAITYRPPSPVQYNQYPDPNALVIYYSGPTKTQTIQGGAFLGTFSGILVGALIGAVAHKKFVIQGKKERFQHMQKKAGLL